MPPGGLQPHFYEDVRPKVWRKATSNSGLQYRMRRAPAQDKGSLRRPRGRPALVWAVWQEASDVAEALGIPGIFEYMKEEMPRIVKGLGDYYPSMAQDAQAHRQTEVVPTGAVFHVWPQGRRTHPDL